VPCALVKNRGACEATHQASSEYSSLARLCVTYPNKTLAVNRIRDGEVEQPYIGLFPGVALPSSPENTWVSVDIGTVSVDIDSLSVDPDSLSEHTIREGGPICYEDLSARLPNLPPHLYEELWPAVLASFAVGVTRGFNTHDPARPPSQISQSQIGLSSAAQQLEPQAEQGGMMSDSGLGSSIPNASPCQNEPGVTTQTEISTVSQQAQVNTPVDFVQAMETPPDMETSCQTDSPGSTALMEAPVSPEPVHEHEVPKGQFEEWLSVRSDDSPPHSPATSAQGEQLLEAQQDPISTRDLVGVGTWSESPFPRVPLHQCGHRPQRPPPISFATPDIPTSSPTSLDRESGPPCIEPLQNWSETNFPL
jgi:hypothetical protein